jgi:hypothetical protein
MKRKTAVSGQFYPADEEQLRSMIGELSPKSGGTEEVLGVLSPHAGYVFSGATAATVFSNIKIPKTIVLLTPSHHYASPPVALWTGGAWETPLGEVQIHESLCDELGKLPGITPDDTPHIPEHSGEVILPFLQYHRPDIQLVAICVTQSATDTDVLRLGDNIYAALQDSGETDALVVASSDMSHEQGPNALERVRKQDPLAIGAMEKLDPQLLLNTCRKRSITMCGVLPAAAMMQSVKRRSGTRGVLIKQATSADSPYGHGDYVVGYAGMIFK